MASDCTVCPLVANLDVVDAIYDAVVVVTDKLDKLVDNLLNIKQPLEQLSNIDKSFLKEVSLVYCDNVPSKRLIFSPTGPLNRDTDDVRRFYEAAVKGIKRAIAAGCTRPLLVRPIDNSFPLAGRVAALGALHAAYVPFEIREAIPSQAQKLVKLGIWCNDEARVTSALPILTALEHGRIIARDIGGSDPETMAAPKCADYLQQVFSDTCIKMKVVSDPNVLQKDFPLLAAVNRAASGIPRHCARLVFLEYEGEGPIDTTLFFVGKGITYDTGGLDIKAGGVMAGMHRDKCGAAAVAGFMKVLSLLKPKNLKVVAGLAFVRNSCGSDGYVSDELITSRAGVRVRIGNTDAEGRMVMSDVLCLMKEKALSAINPYLFTIATLTGHVIRAYGQNYGAVMDNGPARQSGVAQKVQAAGDKCGEPVEISTLRREDFEFNAAKAEYEDVVQANNLPSTMTSRGHQIGPAFMIVASGLDKHGIDSQLPLRYTHMDVAGSSGPFPGIPTAAPLLALTHTFILE